MRQFVIGDIHGAYKGLIQCLQRASFDYNNDLLICLGDVCDGWPETNQAIEELLKIKQLIFILGNHDYWALEWATRGKKSHIWLGQGGQNTVQSYGAEGMPQSHSELLAKAPYYYISANRLFVHAGIVPDEPLSNQSEETFLWDRALAKHVIKNYLDGRSEVFSDFESIYIGHTPIHNYGLYKPVKSCGVWLMDTGAGWDGVLSMMNLETEEVFASDRINTLYPRGTGRSM